MQGTLTCEILGHQWRYKVTVVLAILRPMNSRRRGLQRLYAVLAITWLGMVVYMVASDRWIWEPWRITPTSWDDIVNRSGAVDGPIYTKAAYTLMVPRSTKVMWIAGLSLPMPIVGYLLVFHVSGWVYRALSNRREKSKPTMR